LSGVVAMRELHAGPARSRARRWDAGPMPTARDLAALRWIGEQYTVRLDVAAVLLSRLSLEPIGLLSRRTIRQRVDRWEQAGWITRNRLLGHSWIIATAAGLRHAGLDHLEPWQPAAVRLAHHHAVSLVRLARAVSRFANFFHAIGSSFDAAPCGWSFEDVDVAYLRAPYLAGREDADAACRLLLEDFAHYATLRKPRRGEDATLVFDEFSAIAGGRECAIQLVERVRDAGCNLILSGQSADGLGDEAQQRRLVGACAGGMLIHAMPNPASLLRAAGVVEVVEQTWRLDTDGPTGNSSARLGEQPKITPGQVQQAREGEAWLISRGRYQHLIVTRTSIPPAVRDRARAMLALARAWRPEHPLPGAATWTEVQESAGIAALEVQRHLAIEPPPADPDQATAVLEDPPSPNSEDQDPGGPVDGAGWRLRLAVATAAREADQGEVATLIRHATSLGLDQTMLIAVAEAHWPPGRLPVRVCRASWRWLRRNVRVRSRQGNRVVVTR
jgi:hypothetical protein